MMEIRKATIDDINDLVKLRVDFLQEAQKDFISNNIELVKSLHEYFLHNMVNDHFVAWIYISENKIVATSGLCFYTLPPSYKNISGKVAYIMNMYTIPEYRRKGIARKLFEKMIEESKIRNYKRICLHATNDGKPLYEKYDFKQTDDEMILSC